MKAAILNWIESWKGKGYPDGIPDEAPRILEKTCRAPSYRMICIAIMKNDTTLQTLGFSRPACGLYDIIKRHELMARGNAVRDLQGEFEL